MQVIILAAGRGTRMGPLTDTLAKPMLPVADRPLVAHAATAAVDAGADELIFTVGYGEDQLRAYFGDHYAGVPVTYAVQKEQLGTADAVAAAADAITGPFAVLNGDSLYRTGDLKKLFASAPQIGAINVDNPSNYGVLVTDVDDVVTDVEEKPDQPSSNLINAGAYTFTADTLALLDVPKSQRGEHELTDVLDRLIERAELGCVTFDDWLDVGRPWELLAANERRLPGGSPRSESPGPACSTRLVRSDPSMTSDGGHDVATDMGSPMGAPPKPAIHPSATIGEEVVVEPGVSVGPGVVIEGRVLLRTGCSVGPNAYVRGATLLDEDSHVGHAVEIKNSVLMRGATVGHLSYVGDSILGENVNFGAGTVVANLRHDGEPVSLTVKTKRLSTGRRKFGAVVGPNAMTGIQTGLNPGVTLSANARTAPGENVSRDR